MSFHIRKADINDLDSIISIESKSGYSNWSEKTIAKELSFPRACNLVACHNDEIIAYTFSWLLGVEHEINNIVVSEERRREGLGSLLLKSMLEDAKSFGAKISLLEVASSNKEAIELYRKAGFEEYFVRKQYYKNGEDALLMKKLHL